ncbi:MAG: flagellar biosynthetic protein FliR [Phycisphaerales bacterium]|nr:MAG: flagellar biosynthetic protein FliR [Phycisphaerales bacterium]
MSWSLFDILLSLPAYALVLFRLSGFALVAPVYGSTAIPVRARGAVILVVAAMIFPLVSSQAPKEMTLTGVVVGGVGEMMIGAAIGLSLSILLIGAEVGGKVVGQQAGLILGQVFDPMRNQQASIVGQIYAITLTLMFLLAGGHRAAMAAVLDTYTVIPLLSFKFDDSIILLLIEMLTAAFIMGLRLAAPVTIALFLTATALGFLSRTMPQMNILSVGFLIRVCVALGVASIALSGCQDLFLNAIWDALELIRSAFGLDPSRTGLVT